MYIVFSDIHGNVEALKTFYKYIIRNYNIKNTNLIFLGDLIGYLETTKELIELIYEMKKELKIDFITGNHDEAFLNKDKKEFSGTLAETIQENIKYEKELKNIYKLFSFIPIEKTIGNKKYIFSHGGITDHINDYYYKNSDFNKIVEYNNSYYGYVMGHTHRGFKIEKGDKVFINTGSLGMPRDLNQRLAFVEIYENGKVVFKRLKYNLDREYDRNILKKNEVKNRIYYGGNIEEIKYKLEKFSLKDKKELKKVFYSKEIFERAAYTKNKSFFKINKGEKESRYIYIFKNSITEFKNIEEFFKRRCKR